MPILEKVKFYIKQPGKNMILKGEVRMCLCIEDIKNKLAKEYHKNEKDAQVIIYDWMDVYVRPYIKAKLIWHRPETEIRLAKKGETFRYNYKYCPFCGEKIESK